MFNWRSVTIPFLYNTGGSTSYRKVCPSESCSKGGVTAHARIITQKLSSSLPRCRGEYLPGEHTTSALRLADLGLKSQVGVSTCCDSAQLVPPFDSECLLANCQYISTAVAMTGEQCSTYVVTSKCAKSTTCLAGGTRRRHGASQGQIQKTT